MKRLAIVASHVIQYQAPFFRLLAREPELDVEVIYCSRAGAEVYEDVDMATSLRWDIDLLDGYHHTFLRNLAHNPSGGFWRLVNPGVVPKLLRGRYDAVLLMLGWGSFTAMLAAVTCRLAGIPFLLFGDSSYPPAATSLRARLRDRFLRALFARTSAFMISGVLNGEYYLHYGADRARFFSLPWAVDNERFESASRFAPGEREAMRARYGIAADAMTIVYSAKLVPRKDPMTLLRAVAAMTHRRDAALLFLGDGELRPQLEAFAREAGLDNVRFAGFVNQAELPKHYAMGDLFVLPSTYEPRGSVLNEAMACGLPLVVTDRIGSIGDIVRDGDNAFIYPAGDVDALTVILDRLAADPALRMRMAQRSREIIATWSFAEGVEGVKQAMRSVAR